MIRSILRAARIAAALGLGMAFGIPGALAQAEPPGASIESLLDYAREQNAEYAAMRYEAQAWRERVEPAGALPDPRLRVELQDITRRGERNASLDPSKVGQTRYLFMQDLPWFGKRALKEEAAALEANAADALALGNWTEIAALLKQIHIQRYFLSHNERLTREQLDLIRRTERIAQVRYANGLAPQQDAIRAQVEQTTMRQDLIMLEAERRSLAARLNALLNRPAHSPLAEPRSIPALPQVISVEEVLQRARMANPQLLAEASRIGAAEKTRDLAYRNRYPDVTLGVAPMQEGNSIREWELMLEVSIPLQQGTRRSQEREAGAMLAAARARHEAASQKVTAELAQIVFAYQAAVQTEASVSTSLLPQATLSMQSAVAGYENGKVDFATLIDAQRAVTQARLSELKAQAERQLRWVDIQKLTGESQ